jgi:hypothetical protein
MAPYPRHAHQQPRLVPLLGLGAQRDVVGRDLPPQPAPGPEHGAHHRGDLRAVRHQRLHAVGEDAAAGALDHEAEDLQHAADMVGQLGYHVHELHPGAERAPQPVRGVGLHVHAPVPAQAQDLRQALGVVRVRLVRPQRQGRPRLPGVEADHLEPPAPELVHQPGRQRTSLQTDPRRTTGPGADHLLDRRRVGGALAAPHPTPARVEDAHRRRPL